MTALRCAPSDWPPAWSSPRRSSNRSQARCSTRHRACTSCTWWSASWPRSRGAGGRRPPNEPAPGPGCRHTTGTSPHRPARRPRADAAGRDRILRARLREVRTGRLRAGLPGPLRVSTPGQMVRDRLRGAIDAALPGRPHAAERTQPDPAGAALHGRAAAASARIRVSALDPRVPSSGHRPRVPWSRPSHVAGGPPLGRRPDHDRQREPMAPARRAAGGGGGSVLRSHGARLRRQPAGRRGLPGAVRGPRRSVRLSAQLGRSHHLPSRRGGRGRAPGRASRTSSGCGRTRASSCSRPAWRGRRTLSCWRVPSRRCAPKTRSSGFSLRAMAPWQSRCVPSSQQPERSRPRGSWASCRVNGWPTSCEPATRSSSPRPSRPARPWGWRRWPRACRSPRRTWARWLTWSPATDRVRWHGRARVEDMASAIRDTLAGDPAALRAAALTAAAPRLADRVLAPLYDDNRQLADRLAGRP